MKVCVYVCVCFHPEIWRGLLISPGLSTKPGGDPKCWPPGVPLIVTLSEFP